MLETIYYDGSLDFNKWLKNIEIREKTENKIFRIKANCKGIKGTVIFNGFSDLDVSDNDIVSLICANLKKLKCNRNKLKLLYCPNVKELQCSNNFLRSLICYLAVKIICDNNLLELLECPNVIELHCSDNKLKILYCPNGKIIYCCYNELIKITCLNVDALHCFGNSLIVIECLTNATIVSDLNCIVIRKDKVLKYVRILKPYKTEKYHCNLCAYKKTDKVSCLDCKAEYCSECYINLFEENRGLIPCPYCRTKIGSKVSKEDLCEYVERIKYRYHRVLN